ncbi:MAG TPA: hypothetical protein VK742_20490 [Candidatus Sulfotelmatobacter sp.]|jgi:hypothetical protein|nr:hypothetical protein [Candidatus Sulfotelmatobacter sp.]
MTPRHPFRSLLCMAAIMALCLSALIGAPLVKQSSLLITKPAVVVPPPPPGVLLAYNTINVYEEILSTTNLTTPLTNWTVLARFTNNFPTSFYATNDPANPTKFYVICLMTDNGLVLPTNGIWQFVVTTN